MYSVTPLVDCRKCRTFHSPLWTPHGSFKVSVKSWELSCPHFLVCRMYSVTPLADCRKCRTFHSPRGTHWVIQSFRQVLGAFMPALPCVSYVQCYSTSRL